MKFVPVIVGIMTFSIGVFLGFWFGVERVYVDQENIPTKTTFDMMSIIAGWLGAIGTCLALIFAMYVFVKWRKQVIDEHMLDTAMNILKLNISLKRNVHALFLSKVDGSCKQSNLMRIKSDLDELEWKIEIFYAITIAKGDKFIWFLKSNYSAEDFLRNTKIHMKVVDQLYVLYINGVIKDINDKEIEVGVSYGAYSEFKFIVDSIKTREENHSAIVNKYDLNAKIFSVSQDAISGISKWF
ncbi:hypothetical protein [Vibrio parahaemolyticus]|uniref:hypothetical protein n=2 Tax=Vibrio parahaemolyticus TaxID=670 RepID=UPI0011229691|nr:hypothetical protein [Vibrio parahaemolyticus]EGR1345554.1 hypothetical protein [Vibrio parahaemolyticus]EGR2232529.1 hypothetical protein [Vibrio parahaemolyticus]EIC2575726.1 hypothetical protein [Vibrio parahaemolyticus]EID0039404.1 hypothetical protein [Vibrio parahaemolyticus]EIV8661115.1 hypothetical protein [Vibrio parahaemolyticus]